MIGRLTGKLVLKQPPWLLLEVSGIGYEIEAPMSTFYRLPATGEVISLQTHLVVRDDAHLLYGFGTPAEKALFRSLIKVSGVGPKVALAVLSGISVDDFWNAVRAGQSARLTKTPGIGKKTAERIVVEMRDRSDASAVIDGLAASAPDIAMSPLAEARTALEGLGYKPAEAQRLTDAVHQQDMGTDQIIREALKRALR